MKKWVISLSVLLLVSLCLLPLNAKAETAVAEPGVSIEELTAVLNHTKDYDAEIGLDAYDIDRNGIVEYDDLFALQYQLGVGSPVDDLLPGGTEKDLLTDTDILLLQTAIVRGDSSRALLIEALDEQNSVKVTFDGGIDLSDYECLLIDTLSISGSGTFSVTIHTASGDLTPITVNRESAVWGTVSVALASLSEDALSQVNGLTIALQSGNTICFDNFRVDGTANRVAVTFFDAECTYIYGAGYPYGSLPVATKDGYVFAGWYDNADCAGDEVTADTLVPGEEHTLYAKWMVQKSATITFDDAAKRTEFSTTKQVWSENGITLTNNKGSATSSVADYVNPVRFYKGSNITIACNDMTKIAFVANATDSTDFLKTALTTAGLSFTANGNTVTVVLDEVTDRFDLSLSAGKVFLNSITVTALRPDCKYKVSFNLNYDGAPEAPVSFEVAAGDPYGELPTPAVREGYVFAGWCTDAACSQRAVTAANAVNSAHTLYAKWLECLEVKFDLNYDGATDALAPKGIIAGSPYGELPAPEAREGYTFEGWFVDAACTGNKVTSSTLVYTSHTLYAKWREDSGSDDTVYEEKALSLSFSSTSNRTTYTTSKQVWTQNGVTLTNNKAGSSSNVADYSNPARFYAKSEIIIECSGMKKIVFTASSSSYATALKNSIDGSATASGNNVTVVFDEPVDSFKISSLTAQARVSSITVTALVPVS